MTDSIVKNKFSKPIDSLAINKDNLLRFLRLLQERANSACEMECNHVESLIATENLEKTKEDLRSCAALRTTVVGHGGEELFGSIEEVFDSVSFPEQVKSLYVSSDTIYRSKFNYFPRNRFEVFIDFSKPKVLDFSFFPSDMTPNNSTFNIEGFDNTWVNGVSSEVDKFFIKHSSKLSGIHKNSIYDLIVWTLGIPMAFWTCYKISPHIDSYYSSFMKNALYVYVFFLSLFILRVLFHYFRWLYPKIQYKSAKDSSMIHRSFFYVVTTGIIIAFIYDILRLVFQN